MTAYVIIHATVDDTETHHREIGTVWVLVGPGP